VPQCFDFFRELFLLSQKHGAVERGLFSTMCCVSQGSIAASGLLGGCSQGSFRFGIEPPGQHSTDSPYTTLFDKGVMSLFEETLV
jgi:hypothetical protein